MELNDLNKLPRSLLHVGNVTIFSIGCIFFLIMFFIEYSESLLATVVLTTENPPVRVFSRSEGKLSQLSVVDKQKVHEGQILGVLENPANLQDVETLAQFLKTCDENRIGLCKISLPTKLSLGPMQDSYASLTENIRKYKHFLLNLGIEQEQNSIVNQVEQIVLLNKSLQTQTLILAEEVSISKKNLARNQKLFDVESVSALEVETTEMNYLQKKRQLENIQTEIINNNIRKEQLITQNVNLTQNYSNELFTKASIVRELIGRLQSEIELWRQAYLITAPIDGIVSMSKVGSLFQYFNANQEVFTIIPLEKSGDIIAKCILPIKGSGKVSEGSIANIKLDGYPYREFGTLKATIESIALVPDNEDYIVEMALSDGMVTSYGKEIVFRQEMSGTAEIITAQRSFWDRIIDEVLNTTNN